MSLLCRQLVDLISTHCKTATISISVTCFERRLSETDSIFRGFTFSDIDNLEPIPGAATFQISSAPTVPPGFGRNTDVRNINFVTQYTRIFSFVTTNQLRVGYNYTRNFQTQENQSDFSAQTGILGNDNKDLSLGVPSFRITGFSAFGGTAFDLNSRNHTYTVIDGFVYSAGNHQLKMGCSGERLHGNLQFPIFHRGSSSDILTVPDSQMRDLRALLTMVEGRVVYQDAQFNPPGL